MMKASETKYFAVGATGTAIGITPNINFTI